MAIYVNTLDQGDAESVHALIKHLFITWEYMMHGGGIVHTSSNRDSLYGGILIQHITLYYNTAEYGTEKPVQYGILHGRVVHSMRLSSMCDQ